jgi:hypothetical protein
MDAKSCAQDNSCWKRSRLSLVFSPLVQVEISLEEVLMSATRHFSSAPVAIALGAFALLGLAVALNALTGQIISFQPAGSTHLNVWGINAGGTIAGTWTDINGVAHGFLRDFTSGDISTVDEPDAGNLKNQGTYILALNDLGETTGTYTDSDSVAHGFVRDQVGNFTSFDVFAATSTGGTAINSIGSVVGLYSGDGSFLRKSSGGIETLHIPTSSTTVAKAINSSGQIAGYYVGRTDLDYHGFERSPEGSYTTFGVPLAVNTFVEGLNDTGQTTGFYTDSNSVSHSFLRDASGNISVFDVSSAGKRSGQGTQAYAINLSGAIAGLYTDQKSVMHGFIRLPSGVISTFDDPSGAKGTFATCINNSGQIAGGFISSTGHAAGFIRQ